MQARGTRAQHGAAPAWNSLVRVEDTAGTSDARQPPFPPCLLLEQVTSARTHATLLPGGARGSEQERAPSQLRGTRTGARAHGQTAVSAGLPPELYVFVSKIWFAHQWLWGPGTHVITEPFPGISLPPTCAAWLFSAPPPPRHPPELKPGQSGVAPQSRVCVFACGSPAPCVWPGRALSGLQLAAAVEETGW